MGSKFWKYLGAMMTEKKDGVMAVSFTRTLGTVLFLICTGLWITATVSDAVGSVPPEMVHTLWGLIAIKGAKDVAKGLKGESSYT